VGFGMCGCEHFIFLACDRVHDGLRSVGNEGEMMIETLLLGLVTVLLLVYLVYALLRPEKF
jgi:K+-transporting ATPase KdpF subunit